MKDAKRPVSHRLCLIAAALLAAGFIYFVPMGRARAQSGVTINITATVVKKEVKDGKTVYTGGWNPNRIVVKEGETVTLKITSLDADHGFELPDFNVKTYVPSGQTETVTFTPNKTGIFYFHCGIECGPYHKKMDERQPGESQHPVPAHFDKNVLGGG